MTNLSVVYLNSMQTPSLQFELPSELEASRPAEYRGLRRDQVRLLVLPRFNGEIIHSRFDALGDFLRSGDLLVVNNSRTLPALLQARDENGMVVEVRLAQRRSDDLWEALILENRRQIGRHGMKLYFDSDLSGVVVARGQDLPFLWQVRFDRCCADLLDLIYRLGIPVQYSYVPDRLPLDLYQTVYASRPGSLEMPSAGRPFSWELLFKLKQKGVEFVSITLHTGLSSTRDDVLDASHPIYEEEYEVPELAALAVNDAHRRGGRVIAVGTTVVRALETVALSDGTIVAEHGHTKLHIAQGMRLKVVDSLLTGLHEPQSSHLDLLSALVEPDRLMAAYRNAIQQRYLWHEFGDMNLIL